MLQREISWPIIADGLISLIVGAIMFFRPDIPLNVLFIDGVDGVSMHLCRCIGGQQIALAYAALIMGRSYTGDAKTTHLTLRVTGFGLMAAMTQHARKNYDTLFNVLTGVKLSLLTFVVCTILAVLLAVYNVRRKWPLGTQLLYTEHWQMIALVQFDAIAATLIGTAWMAFPDFLLARQVSIPLTGVHVYLGRMMGCWFTASACYSMQCYWWQCDQDRRSFAYARAIMCICIFMAQIYSQWAPAYHQHWGGTHWIGITLFSTWTLTALWFNLVNPLVDQGIESAKSK